MPMSPHHVLRSLTGMLVAMAWFQRCLIACWFKIETISVCDDLIWSLFFQIFHLQLALFLNAVVSLHVGLWLKVKKPDLNYNPRLSVKCQLFSSHSFFEHFFPLLNFIGQGRGRDRSSCELVINHVTVINIITPGSRWSQRLAWVLVKCYCPAICLLFILKPFHVCSIKPFWIKPWFVYSLQKVRHSNIDQNDHSETACLTRKVT